MENQPTGQAEKSTEATEATNYPNPSLTEKKEAADSNQDTKANAKKSAAVVVPNTRWQRFKIWASDIKFSDAVMLLLTAVIAAGTIVSAKAIFLQYREMHEGGVQTDKIIAADERIASGIENTVAQANKALNASINASRMDQRAWVAPFEVQTKRNGPMTYFEVVYKNTGKTPALKTTSSIGTTDSLEKIPAADTQPTTSGVMAPEGIFNTSTVDHPFSPEVIAMIKKGLPTYIYGTIWYMDVFTAKQHWTQFCFRAGKDLKGFGPCADGKHNQTDDAQNPK